ncbi:hypothetical protein Q056_05834 [Pseudomonas aeruginosa BL02]|nr:hypothetical protein Q086_02400 [Pseudomonas aeruginosa C23]ERU82154.1 hypothetical protein Q085_02397 [Pseudomonas aeruginosa C20]ERW04744.1 hypothetical protein Q037_02118 [Pseudomonas aeruginosa BWHPSA024]ERW11315.1 hypothetical protein Q036_05877 [Pseudomonas aeruginosa BWHPSA023]ERW85100.1 hypothetical protein Q018_02426 [Pseudomonas aeruginosa BWHPSA005]ERX59356.1 hypothetical protein Q002_01525 [Pseudomonas aeruginosa CF18]ERY55626.1 hypothetical protein Q056_05834 [Pseudomonas aeru
MTSALKKLTEFMLQLLGSLYANHLLKCSIFA